MKHKVKCFVIPFVNFNLKSENKSEIEICSIQFYVFGKLIKLIGYVEYARASSWFV